jgi:hypothetical protein
MLHTQERRTGNATGSLMCVRSADGVDHSLGRVSSSGVKVGQAIECRGEVGIEYVGFEQLLHTVRILKEERAPAWGMTCDLRMASAAGALIRPHAAQLTGRATTFASTVPPTAYAAMPSLDRSG